MEAHDSGSWSWVIASANAVLAVTFVWFALSLLRATKRYPKYERANVFRRALGSWLMALGAFFIWIFLAWASVVDFSERVHASLLIVCALLGIAAVWRWRVASEGDW